LKTNVDFIPYSVFSTLAEVKSHSDHPDSAANFSPSGDIPSGTDDGNGFYLLGIQGKIDIDRKIPMNDRQKACAPYCS